MVDKNKKSVKVNDFVRISNFTGDPQIAIVSKISRNNKYVLVHLLNGKIRGRTSVNIEKLTDGEAMLFKLENL